MGGKGKVAAGAWGLSLEQARGQLLPLGVVCMGLGIGLWFAWPSEPGSLTYGGAGVLGLGLAALGWRGALLARFGAALILGFCLCGLRLYWVEAPVLPFRYYGPVEGQIVIIDRSSSDAVRITLAGVILGDMAPDKTPKRVRISLHGQQFTPIEAGRRVMITAHLSPPSGPAEPGGFDFRRMAYFDQIGALGYARSPLVTWAPASWSDEWVGRLRSHLAQIVRSHIEGQAGAFAAGSVTGDRSGISQATVEALRDSSLSHILAISGMNMAFLCGFIFAFLRRGMALLPWLALRVNTKKLSAVISIGVAWFYLQLSGHNVATERAFLMIVVMMGAILLDRRAISLRTAALAAGLQLMLRPEALLEAGFQMSFAATIALIAGFRAVEAYGFARGWPRPLAALFTLLLSSLIGGLASGPFAAAHFNRFADYGLLANVLTVPAMGILIMPMAALAIVFAPLGLSFIPLWLMGLGAEWTLFVAHWIAAMEGSVTAIVKPEAWVLALLSLGGLWLILWPNRLRLAGLAVMAISLIFWANTPRPDLLIEAEGRVAGLMLGKERSVSQPKTGGFSVENWLENDGDLGGQEKAASRGGFDGPKEARSFSYRGARVTLLNGKRGLARLEQACADSDLVIVAQPAIAPPARCNLVDQSLLARTGALALYGDKIAFANDKQRLWQREHPFAEDLMAFAPLQKAISKTGLDQPNAPVP